MVGLNNMVDMVRAVFIGTVFLGTAGGRHVGGVDKVPDEGPGWAHQREVYF